MRQHHQRERTELSIPGESPSGGLAGSKREEPGFLHPPRVPGGAAETAPPGYGRGAPCSLGTRKTRIAGSRIGRNTQAEFVEEQKSLSVLLPSKRAPTGAAQTYLTWRIPRPDATPRGTLSKGVCGRGR